MIQTTLAEIKKHNPCKSRWKKLLKNLGGIQGYGKDTPLTLLQILDSNGLNDALWVLRACGNERFARLLACDYAEHLPLVFKARYSNGSPFRKAIEVSRKFCQGQATAAEAAAAAWAAAEAAAAADAVIAEAEERWQEERLRELLEAES